MATEAPTIAEVVNESASDSIRAVMSEMDKGGDTPTTGGETDGNVESGTAPAPATTSDGDRVRDPSTGRFVAKTRDGDGDGDGDGEASDVVGATDGDRAGSEADSGAASGAASESVPAEEDDLEPPPEWSAEEQDQFRALAPEARKIVLGRVTAAQEQQQAAEALKARYGGLEQLIAPRKQFWERDGLDEVGGVRQLLALSDFAAQDAPGFLRWFAQQRGLNPAQIWQAQQPQPQSGQFDYVDPEVAALKAEVDGFKQYLQTHQQQQQQQQRQAEQAQYELLRNELSEFASAKDDKGRSQHPYFEEVRDIMGSFYASKKASDLTTAYDMACRAHPGVYAKIESANRAKAASEQARQQREKAATARQAGSSVSGTPGDRAKPEPSGDLREDLRREFQERGMLRA